MNRSSSGKKGKKKGITDLPEFKNWLEVQHGLGKGTVMGLVPILLIVAGAYELGELTAVVCPWTITSCVT